MKATRGPPRSYGTSGDTLGLQVMRVGLQILSSTWELSREIYRSLNPVSAETAPYKLEAPTYLDFKL
eukprot:1160804-Pelagomonas_calceolata.AAC.9